MEKILEMGGSVEKKNPNSLGSAFSLCRRPGIDAALAKADFFFAGVPPPPLIENKIEQKIQTLIRKILVSAKNCVRNSGAGNGCANFMDTWKNCVLSASKPMSIKFLVLGGGVFWGLGGGGSADFIFMGARIFLN